MMDLRAVFPSAQNEQQQRKKKILKITCIYELENGFRRNPLSKSLWKGTKQLDHSKLISMVFVFVRWKCSDFYGMAIWDAFHTSMDAMDCIDAVCENCAWPILMCRTFNAKYTLFTHEKKVMNSTSQLILYVFSVSIWYTHSSDK